MAAHMPNCAMGDTQDAATPQGAIAPLWAVQTATTDSIAACVQRTRTTGLNGLKNTHSQAGKGRHGFHGLVGVLQSGGNDLPRAQATVLTIKPLHNTSVGLRSIVNAGPDCQMQITIKVIASYVQGAWTIGVNGRETCAANDYEWKVAA
jgi:hypothetical protein